MKGISKLPLFVKFASVILVFGSLKGFSQESQITSEAVDTLNSKIENVKSDLELFKRLKITGYIQAQWQLDDTIGSSTPFSGGSFPKYSNNRFELRRGRIKFTYENELSTYVLQIDATEKGVGLKDAYVAVKDPWFQFATLTAGVFNRHFGNEITYSSSARETPERARIFQTLFPQERDMGAMITLQPKKGTQYDWIKLDAAVVAGNGINPEFDRRKDFIGHLYFDKANKAGTYKYGAGVSYYNGGVFQGTRYIYTPGAVSDVSQPGLVDSTTSNKYAFAKRRYLGFDAHFSAQSPMGFTTVRAEYLTGKQPGSKGGNTSISSGTAPDYDIYNRNFSGGYVYFIQGIGQTKNQLVVKYDWYDPNTKVKGSEIMAKSGAGKNTALGNADIKFCTLGLGWNYRFNTNVKFTAYYEFVRNETTALPTAGTTGTTNTTKDLKDNVLTLRVQYKF